MWRWKIIKEGTESGLEWSEHRGNDHDHCYHLARYVVIQTEGSGFWLWPELANYGLRWGGQPHRSVSHLTQASCSCPLPSPSRLESLWFPSVLAVSLLPPLKPKGQELGKKAEQVQASCFLEAGLWVFCRHSTADQVEVTSEFDPIKQNHMSNKEILHNLDFMEQVFSILVCY